MDYVRTCQSIYGLCADLAVNIWILCKLGCQDTRVCGLLQPYIDNQHSNVLWIAHRILTLADCHDPYHGNSDMTGTVSSVSKIGFSSTGQDVKNHRN